MRIAAFLLGLGFALSAACASWPGGDAGVPPGDDFFEFANGGWIKSHPIPADRSGFSIATILTQQAQGRVRTLLEEAARESIPEPTDEQQKVGAYYAAFMDEQRVEELSRRPLRPALLQIERAADRTTLAHLMGAANSGFHGSLFSLWIEPDEHDAGHNALHLGQDGLGALDRNFYLVHDGASARQAYSNYVRRMLMLVGWPRPEVMADDVIAFETQVAKASATAADRRDEAKSYDPTTIELLKADVSAFPWKAYFHSAEIEGNHRVIVVDHAAIPKLAALFNDTPLPVLRAWAAFHLADNAAPYLPAAFVMAHFDFHGRVVAGQQLAPPRWRRGLQLVSGGGWKDMETSRGAMGDAVGRIYTARWLDPRSRELLRSLVSNMKTVLKSRIAASDWMSATTRAEALHKVDAVRVEIGAPSSGDTYDSLRIGRDDLYGDVERATSFAWTGARAMLGQSVDRARWTITPQTVNAYNYAPFNELVFTAALLQPPAFDPGQDLALTYGGIGAIIGHELTHGFDDVGRKFDADGRRRDWWASDDDARFRQKADRLDLLFSACQPLPGLHVDGRLTLGENLADIGGLQLAYAAYRVALGGKPAPTVDGFTGDQRFFLGFAMLRRGQRRAEALRGDVASDPHSPDRCRVDEDVRHIAAWYSAFAIKDSDPLYLAPRDRVQIW